MGMSWLRKKSYERRTRKNASALSPNVAETCKYSQAQVLSSVVVVVLVVVVLVVLLVVLVVVVLVVVVMLMVVLVVAVVMWRWCWWWRWRFGSRYGRGMVDVGIARVIAGKIW